MFSSLANKLTASRIVVIPVILVLLFLQTEWAAWVALVLFVAAGITDMLDGYLARRGRQVSMIGEFLDPIADKLLVAAVILLLVYNGHIRGSTIVPAVIITMREVAVSGLREFLANLRVSMPVSKLAKWKTFLQIWAVSFLIGGDYAPAIHATQVGDICLWIAGVITVVTAWDYWRAAVKYFKD